MTVYTNTPIELIEGVYTTLEKRLTAGREYLGRPLTYAEKILINHLDTNEQELERGTSYVDLRPDRVAMPVSYTHLTLPTILRV